MEWKRAKRKRHYRRQLPPSKIITLSGGEGGGGRRCEISNFQADLGPFPIGAQQYKLLPIHFRLFIPEVESNFHISFTAGIAEHANA